MWKDYVTKVWETYSGVSLNTLYSWPRTWIGMCGPKGSKGYVFAPFRTEIGYAFDHFALK